MEKLRQNKNKRLKPIINFENVPNIKSLSDLIEMGKSIKFYKNIDSIMLWKITPHLEELENLVGMHKLKESIFYQILYYIQKMHIRNEGEDYLHTMLMGPPGTGKCLAKDTPVIMFNGQIKMVQNIMSGEFIMGDDSTKRKVLSITSGKEMMYTVIQDVGDDYTVNESHILSLKLSKNPYYIKTDIKTDNKNLFTLYWYDFNGKQKIDNLFENDILKLIEFLPKYGDIIDISIKEYLNRSEDWKIAFKGYKKCLFFTAKHVEKPYNMGVLWGSENEYLNQDYFINSFENRLQLLAGFIDEVGIFLSDKVKIVKPIKFSERILFLVFSLGLKLYSYTDDTDKIIYIYGNLSIIPSKKYNFSNFKDLNLMYNIKIEKNNINTYYGFEIDGNKRFLLGDCTVTHNTTVAKILSKIYSSMGVLSENGPFKIAHRDDFIAGYLGQTAIKTQKLLNSCIGGVLFIDEVYALAPGKDDKDSFSKEALDTLTSFLSEHKSDFCCIAAGYESDIENCFYAMNQGLKRRFPWVHKIEKYSSLELAEIFLIMVKNVNWDISTEKQKISNIIEKNSKYFTNAGGDIETFLTKCKMAHSRRIISLDKKHKFILTEKDLEAAIELVKNNKNKIIDNSPPLSMYM